MHNQNNPSDKTGVDSQTSAEQKTNAGTGKIRTVRRRHEKIRQHVLSKGYVTIDYLAGELEVTPQTIRRDINSLSEEGLLNRYHGGAGLASSAENLEYTKRKVLCLKEKQQIAKVVADRIPYNTSLFINIGTTTEAIASALRNHQRLRVITNNLNVASILSGNENFEIIVAGGMVRHRDGGIVGPLTIDFIQQFRVDYGIIGISGIDMDGTLLDFDYREVRASRAIIDNARKVFLAADHTKFGRNAMVRLGHIGEIDELFTDRQPPTVLSDILAQGEVQLHVVGDNQDVEI